jgi:hypothetical protein
MKGKHHKAPFMKWLILVALLPITHLSLAQEVSGRDSIKVVPTAQQGKLYFAPIPVIGANPAFGIIYGAAASASMFLGDPSATRMSNALITATYSTKTN